MTVLVARSHTGCQWNLDRFIVVQRLTTSGTPYMLNLIRQYVKLAYGWTLLRSTNFHHLRPVLPLAKTWHGTAYGGFFVHEPLLKPSSIVYSVGVGEDISFDTSLIKNCRCKVWAFDPTPRSAEWLAGRSPPPEFTFVNIGIGPEDKDTAFYLPKNPAHVSGSFLQQTNVNPDRVIYAKMKSIASVTKILGHTFLDLLKLDIEGSEYEVIHDLLKQKFFPQQIVVEFHDRLFPDLPNRSKYTVALMAAHGYRLFAISPSLQEASFVRTTANQY